MARQLVPELGVVGEWMGVDREGGLTEHLHAVLVVAGQLGAVLEGGGVEVAEDHQLQQEVLRLLEAVLHLLDALPAVALGAGEGDLLLFVEQAQSGAEVLEWEGGVSLGVFGIFEKFEIS